MLTDQMHPWHDVVFAPVDLDVRLPEIEKDKPAKEQFLRHFLIAIKVDLSKLPKDVRQARIKLYAAHTKLDAARIKFYAACEKHPDLHAKLCVSNCPWNGKTIFTHKDASGNWCLTYARPAHRVDPEY